MPDLVLTEADLTLASTYARRMDDATLADKLLRAIGADPVAVTLREILTVLQASREELRQIGETQRQTVLELGQMRASIDELRHDLTDDELPVLATGEVPAPVAAPAPEASIASRCMTLVEQRFDSIRNAIIILTAILAGGGVTSQMLAEWLHPTPDDAGIVVPLGPVPSPVPLPDLRVSVPMPAEPMEAE